jgi:DNA-directed RNA polymerase subunit H (RpoH/RPB5)
MSSKINSNFEMSELERQHSTIKTIINMLVSRQWISESNKLDVYNKIIGTKNELIDSKNIICDLVDKKVAIKIYNSKLNSLKNDKEIDVFIAAYPDNHKILIVNDIMPKAKKQVSDSRGFEVFTIMEVIRDITEHDLIPKHILLSKEDADKLMNEYQIQKKDMGRILIDDPMARYLYAQKDDIIQIIRYSINSGYSTYYRLVVVGSIYI